MPPGEGAVFAVVFGGVSSSELSSVNINMKPIVSLVLQEALGFFREPVPSTVP